MWLNKFLDLEEDIEKLGMKFNKDIFRKIKKTKLTPLEVTILEAIFNVKTISGYDLIEILNSQFAKTWQAKSGTIYPILNKLQNPLNCPPLKSSLNRNSQVAIVVNDATRKTPTKEILPSILKSLQVAGIPPEQIIFIFA